MQGHERSLPGNPLVRPRGEEGPGISKPPSVLSRGCLPPETEFLGAFPGMCSNEVDFQSGVQSFRRSSGERAVEPMVGIACGHTPESGRDEERYFVNRDYADSIEAAGGLPILIPPVSLETLPRILDQVDAVLLPGGPDIDPDIFGEEPLAALGRVDPVGDQADLAVARLALQRDFPVLGICRGLQVLNVAAGGSLYQDIGRQIPNSLKHYQQAPRHHPTHEVRLRIGTLVHGMFGADRVRVNSFHHQSAKDLAPGFVVSAVSSDDVVEAIESRVHRFAVGVQWHPEGMWRHHPDFLNAFRRLVEAAGGPGL